MAFPPIMSTGLGDQADSYPEETLRRAAGAALRAASSNAVAVALPTGDEAGLVEAVGLGAFIGAYRYPGKPAGEAPRPTPMKLTVLVGATKGLKQAATRAQVIGEAIHLTRRLVDTPPGALPPAGLAAEAVAAVEGTTVDIDVLDEKALRKQKFGGILAVGQGSANPPRLVRLAYSPPGARAHLALVGKGITFDSGGLSLKPPAGMITMKCDMAGAAAVLAAVRAIALLGIPLRVTAYLAIAENMPSGAAQRPGDVITAYGGKTVEVLNTDAEGRLVMMDALARCGADEPDAIIDVATLTGAQVVALGSRIAGVMGNDDGWRDEVHAAGGVGWRAVMADAHPRGDAPIAGLPRGGPGQHRRAQRRDDDRRGVPARVRPRGCAVGPSGHRRTGVQLRGSVGLQRQGGHWLRRPDAGRGRRTDGRPAGLSTPAFGSSSTEAPVAPRDGATAGRMCLRTRAGGSARSASSIRKVPTWPTTSSMS